MNDHSPLAECRAVSRRFGQFTAVDGVDLRLGRGEVVGLLGANGAGKTTLIRMLLGLLSPTAGQVRLFGGPPSRPARRRVGYVPQTLGLYDDLTPAENLAFSASDLRPRHPGRTARITARDTRRVLVGDLPLGVQRRVAFTEALAHRPDLLILDEPTSGVDPLARARLWETITDAAQASAGVLVTTHYMDEAGECGRLVIMAAGRVVATGTAAEIIGDARVERGRDRRLGGGVRRAGSGRAAGRAGGPGAAGARRQPGRGPAGARPGARAGQRGPGHAGRALLPAHPGRTRFRSGPGGRMTPRAAARARSSGRTGRRGGDSGTREAILDAARKRFAEHGYRRRHDPRHRRRRREWTRRWSHHFYGTKERLFAAAMRLPVVPGELISSALAAGAADPGGSLGEHLVRAALSAWDVARDP